MLDVKPLRVRRRITLRGDFSYDALSPDGRRMYVINYVSSSDPRKYVVRSLDMRTGRLEPGTIVDAREPDEDMRGFPVTRATSTDGRWEYTLYDGGGEPFVHALDTVDRAAACIDLHLLEGHEDPYSLDLRLGGPGGLHRARRRPAGRADRHVDVRGERAAAGASFGASGPPPPLDDGGVDWWIAGFFAAFGMAVAVLRAADAAAALRGWGARSCPARPGRRTARGWGVQRLGGRLDEAHVVAERVAQAAVDAVEVLGRLLGELDALGLELLVGAAAVVGGEPGGEAGRALGDEVADLRGGRVVHGGRAGPLEQDLAVGVAGDADGQPAHEAEVDVGADLEAELADVEVERLVLVEDEDARRCGWR